MSKKPASFWEYYYAYPAAAYLVNINIAVYIFTHFLVVGNAMLPSLILYPESLDNGNYWALLTTGFIHYDFWHLFWNMLGVFIFGRIVERHLGFWKMIFVFFGALGLSMFFSIKVNSFLFGQTVAIIGASGAVMGLVGAAMLLDPFEITYEMIFPMPVMFKGWLFLYLDIQGLLGGQRDGISHISHLFGFFSIGVLIYFLSRRDKKKMMEGLLVNIVSLILFLFLWKFLIYWKAQQGVTR